MKRFTLALLSILAMGLTATIAAEEKDEAMNKAKTTQGSGITRRAIFAGGCFWCMEPPFEKLSGVLEVNVGFDGGQQPDPSYEQVSSGQTRYAEAIEIVYDPALVSYETLLEVFWRNIDPTDDGGQFVDRGRQYRSAIFYLDDEQKSLAEASKQILAETGRFDKPIVTEIVPSTRFYPAEDYHQDYYKKNPIRYRFYRYNSGRDQFLERAWPKRDSDTISH